MDVRECTSQYREQQWMGIIQECKNSGQSNRAWCQERNINLKSFYYWQHKLRLKGAEEVNIRNATALAVQERRAIVPVQFPEMKSRRQVVFIWVSLRYK